VFDLYFRKNPFDGEFTVFAGLSSAIDFIANYKFSAEDISFLQRKMPDTDPKFFDWLATVDCSKVKVYALEEGTVAFPLVPLLRVEGPLAICQLLETTLLTLINYARCDLLMSSVLLQILSHVVLVWYAPMLLVFALQLAKIRCYWNLVYEELKDQVQISLT